MTNKILIWIAVIGIMFLSLYGVHNTLVKSAVLRAETTLSQKYEEKLTASKDLARDVERQLTKDFNEITKQKDKKLRDTDNKLVAALNELRKRPQRISGANSPTVADLGKACTGAELYGEDAEFLTREAARADSLVIERDSYYDRYEQARRRLDEIANRVPEASNVTEGN